MTFLAKTKWRRKALWTGVAIWCAMAGLSAQKPVTVVLDSVFFGDNGEFFSPFRTGETILGSWQRLDADNRDQRPRDAQAGRLHA